MNDVELDWIFYEHIFSDSTSIKVGKIQIPYGFYNEIRDVGVILPLYRAPISVYGEGTYTSETLNGFVLSHSFFPESDWNLDTDFYYGDWTSTRNYGEMFFKEPVKDMVGINLWLNTPYQGIRIGTGILRYSAPPLGAPPNVESVSWKMFSVSGEISFNKFLFRTEYIYVSDPDSRSYAGYALLTYKPTKKISYNLFSAAGIKISEPIAIISKPQAIPF